MNSLHHKCIQIILFTKSIFRFSFKWWKNHFVTCIQMKVFMIVEWAIAHNENKPPKLQFQGIFDTSHTPTKPCIFVLTLSVFFFFVFLWMGNVLNVRLHECIHEIQHFSFQEDLFKRWSISILVCYFDFDAVQSLLHDISTLLLFTVNIFASFFKHSYVCWSTNCSANCITIVHRA